MSAAANNTFACRCRARKCWRNLWPPSPVCSRRCSSPRDRFLRDHSGVRDRYSSAIDDRQRIGDPLDAAGGFRQLDGPKAHVLVLDRALELDVAVGDEDFELNAFEISVKAQP